MMKDFKKLAADIYAKLETETADKADQELEALLDEAIEAQDEEGENAIMGYLEGVAILQLAIKETK